MAAPAYGRGSHEVTGSHHSSSSSAASRHGYAKQAGGSAHFDNSRSAGDVRHHSSNWSAGDRDNVGRGYQGTGYGGAGTHFTFSTETSDISDNIGASYQNSHLSNAERTGLLAQGIGNRTRFQDHQTSSSTQDNTYGFDNAGSNQFGSELQESARGSGGFRHYIWTPEISGDPTYVDRSRHESSISGLDSARGHIGRNSHIGIETDNAAVGQQWHSGSGSAQYGAVDEEEAGRRQHGVTPSGSYVWGSADTSATAQHSSNNEYGYDAWRRGHSAYGTSGDKVDVSQHYSSNYGRDYSGDRRGSGAHGTGGSVDLARHYSSSSSGSDDAAGQHGGGSQHYSSHYESGAKWSSSDRTDGENKLEGSEDRSSGQLKLYRKYRHHSSGEGSSKARQSRRQRRNVDDAELEQATRCNTTRCSKMRCVLGPMAKGEEVKFAFRFLVWAKTLKSVSLI
jgi:hypothetical protein